MNSFLWKGMKMKRISMSVVLLAALFLGGCFRSATIATSENPVVRVGVTGGMVKSGMWAEVARMFEAESGYKIDLVARNSKGRAKVFPKGEADLITQHAGFNNADLIAKGYGTNLRPWVHDEQVIVGPKSDPAGIKGMKDGAAALRRIAETKSNFVTSRHRGSEQVCHVLWKKAKVQPVGAWVLKDESPHKSDEDLIFFAKSKNAYTVGTRRWMLFADVPPDMEIMVQGDPEMQRPYVVIEANPQRFPNINRAAARALSDFFVSDKVQKFLAGFRAEEFGGTPIFYPLKANQPHGK